MGHLVLLGPPPPFLRRKKPPASESWRRLALISRVPLIVRNIQVRMLLAILVAIQCWELVGLVPWDPDIGVFRSRVFETSEESPFTPLIGGHRVINNALHDGFISVPSDDLNWVIR
jgi:hypothetical protein